MTSLAWPGLPCHHYLQDMVGELGGLNDHVKSLCDVPQLSLVVCDGSGSNIKLDFFSLSLIESSRKIFPFSSQHNPLYLVGSVGCRCHQWLVELSVSTAAPLLILSSRTGLASLSLPASYYTTTTLSTDCAAAEEAQLSSYSHHQQLNTLLHISQSVSKQY